MKKSFIMPFVWWDISAFQNPTVQVQMIMFTKYLHLQSFNLKHNYLVTTLKNPKGCERKALPGNTSARADQLLLPCRANSPPSQTCLPGKPAPGGPARMDSPAGSVRALPPSLPRYRESAEAWSQAAWGLTATVGEALEPPPEPTLAPQWEGLTFEGFCLCDY